MKSNHEYRLIIEKPSKWALILTLYCIIVSAFSNHALAWQEEVKRVDRTGANPSTPVRKPGQRRELTPISPMIDPRRWIFIAVVAFLLLGGLRRLLIARNGRLAADCIADGAASLQQIRESAQHGRVVLPSLLAMLTESEKTDRKNAAFESLLLLWQADELIAEEEKAILTRAIQVAWKQRRKYPLDFDGKFHIQALINLPGVSNLDTQKWLHEHLIWETRFTGTRRAADDQWRTLEQGEMKSTVEINSADFKEQSLHRIMLFTRVTTKGLTTNWSLDLPSQTTSFEWDQHLKVDAIRAEPDEAELKQMSEALSWSQEISDQVTETKILQISQSFGILNPPVAQLQLPLPRDIAHQVNLVISGIEKEIVLDAWVLACRNVAEHLRQQMIVMKVAKVINDDEIRNAGNFQAKLQLSPRPEMGWADPDIRSVFPESLEFPWVEIEIVRL